MAKPWLDSLSKSYPGGVSRASTVAPGEGVVKGSSLATGAGIRVGIRIHASRIGIGISRCIGRCVRRCARRR